MTKCDIAAMEEGARNSGVFVAIVTDNGAELGRKRSEVRGFT
jgi:hypothetical protein